DFGQEHELAVPLVNEEGCGPHLTRRAELARARGANAEGLAPHLRYETAHVRFRLTRRRSCPIRTSSSWDSSVHSPGGMRFAPSQVPERLSSSRTRSLPCSKRKVA